MALSDRGRPTPRKVVFVGDQRTYLRNRVGLLDRRLIPLHYEFLGLNYYPQDVLDEDALIIFVMPSPQCFEGAWPDFIEALEMCARRFDTLLTAAVAYRQDHEAERGFCGLTLAINGTTLDGLFTKAEAPDWLGELRENMQAHRFFEGTTYQAVPNVKTALERAKHMGARWAEAGSSDG